VGESTGTPASWTQIPVDEDLGLVYLPVETQTSDFYGGHRPGNNLFAERPRLRRISRRESGSGISTTGPPSDLELRHVVRGDSGRHHRERRAIKAVAVPGKQGFLFVFDRRHRAAGVADRRACGPAVRRARGANQPDAAVPDQAAGVRAQHAEDADDLIDFTPELRAQRSSKSSATRWRRGCTNPAVLGNVNGILGAINMGNAVGGHQLPGVAYDPETHTIIANANNAGITATSLVTPPSNSRISVMCPAWRGGIPGSPRPW